MTKALLALAIMKLSVFNHTEVRAARPCRAMAYFTVVVTPSAGL